MLVEQFSYNLSYNKIYLDHLFLAAWEHKFKIKSINRRSMAMLSQKTDFWRGKKLIMQLFLTRINLKDI